MEIVILPDLSEAQKKHVRKVPTDYVPPPIEGMYDVNKKNPDGIIHIYVGNCDWKDDFDFCLRKFTLVVFMKSCMYFSVQTWTSMFHMQKESWPRYSVKTNRTFTRLLNAFFST